MSIFLSDDERAAIRAKQQEPAFADVWWTLYNRAKHAASQAGLRDAETTQEYWHMAFDVLSNAAMMYALKPDEQLGSWVRSATLELLRRPDEEWVGPWYRDHAGEPRQGHLETAHLAWACAVSLDLARDVFSETEQDELETKLRDVAIPLCRQFLQNARHMNNWQCILAAGVAVPAAVLDDRESMDIAAERYRKCAELFQPDGSYGESLQYSHYAQTGMYLIYEALVRRDPSYAATLTPERYARGVRWSAASYFYHKPLASWGPYPRPRAANFNDSAAVFRPPADVLLHINLRCRESLPTEAGLARWLFDVNYTGDQAPGPNERSSFGFYNTFGFLTLPLLAQAGEAIPASEAGITELEAFSNGDAIVRDALDGKTIVAVYGGCDPLHVKSHRHAALNSGIVVHNRERMLIDPGHSCYRGLVHGMETQTQTHNAVTFSVDGRQLQQSVSSERRPLADDMSENLLSIEATRLITDSVDDVRIIGHDAAAAYGAPIEAAERFWILCGSHVLFIVDHYRSSSPARATYNWLLNNRDDLLELKPVPPDRLVARRGQCGMKLFHLGGGRFAGPVYSFVHDCYHPLPSQTGEGAAGTGRIVRWTDADAATEGTTIHAIALDSYGAVANWHLRDADATGARVERGDEDWECRVDGRGIVITNHGAGVRYVTSCNSEVGWLLVRQ